MSTPSTPGSTTPSPATTSSGQHSSTGAGKQLSTRSGGEATLVTEHGRTTIADTVVSKIAGMAAREVSGVYKLGGGTARAFGAIRERIPGATSSISQGVAVEVGERQAAVDLDVMVEYGVAIADLAEGIRRNVITAIEAMTGLEVTEVNITVDDIHLPDDEDSDDGDTGRGTRVQ